MPSSQESFAKFWSALISPFAPSHQYSKVAQMSSQAETQLYEDVDGASGHVATSSTSNDVRDMHRMALPFKLHRRFTSLTVFGFACILGATWEYALVTSLAALTNGGSGGVIWLFFAVMFGMFSVVLSLAEMASIAPTSAGQYHWVSEFAPPKYQRIASYGVGESLRSSITLTRGLG
jgi:amino acid permease